MLVLGLKARPLQQIAVVEMEGTIGPRLKPGEFVRLFRSLEENPRIRAVVLDIDSPGGSAPGSNYLALGVASLVRKKPVIAFIRGVGASGAYMLSAPASRIVAIPSAIIGSIGVISMHPLLKEGLDKLGVTMHVTKSDRLKDMGSMFRDPTPEEQAKEQELVDDLYDQFLESVAAGRHMDIARVKEIATGEVFTGRRSKELGLVDELGDLDHAIDVAAELSSSPRNPVWVKPKKNLRELVGSMVGQSVAGALVSEVVSQLEERVASKYDFHYRARGL